jgi:RNA 2',3'-cyclic 3'-phosphodiesterase
MHRLFVAINLPEDVKETLANVCFGVPGARWVPKDQMHLTLRFIGDADSALLDDIADALDNVNASTFNLALHGTGYFPPRRKPTVLWTGIIPCPELIDLRDSVEDRMKELGLPDEERKYHAHVTLARLGANAPLDQITAFLSATGLLKTEPFSITEFHLYNSTLTPDGPVYDIIESFDLI